VLHAVVGRQDGEAPARAAVAAASAAAPSIRLAIALGKALLRELELSRDLIRIGSDARQDVRLVDPEIAPQHCCIRQLRGELFLADLGAPAGTLVNGRRARVERLRPGDAIAVGPFTILFQPDAPQLAVLTRARKK
jgi:pSer/pThr/pTyr-binding forkhead associated (FHA) protein